MMKKGQRGMVRTGTAALGATLMAIALAASPVGATPFTGHATGQDNIRHMFAGETSLYFQHRSLIRGYTSLTGAVQCYLQTYFETSPESTSPNCDGSDSEYRYSTEYSKYDDESFLRCQSEDGDGTVWAEPVAAESYICVSSECFSPSSDPCTETPHVKFNIIGGTGMYEDSAGSYTMTATQIYRADGVLTTEYDIAGDLTLAGDAPPDDVVLDIPAQGSTQSGIGLVSGWSCLGGHLEVEFSEADGTPLSTWSLPHGADRGDTQEKCGDSENGFSMPFNWYHLGPGAKTLTLFVNGEERVTRNFSVTTFGEEFITDAGGMCEIADFRDGQNATFVWEQANQGLVLESLN